MYPTPTQEKIIPTSFLGRLSKLCESGKVSRQELNGVYADAENIFTKFVYAIPEKLKSNARMVLDGVTDPKGVIDSQETENHILLTPFGYSVVVKGAATVSYRIGKNDEAEIENGWVLPLQENAVQTIEQVVELYDGTNALQRMKFIFGYNIQRKNAEVLVDRYMEMFHPEVKITL
jgi:hypothetical protein